MGGCRNRHILTFCCLVDPSHSGDEEPPAVPPEGRGVVPRRGLLPEVALDGIDEDGLLQPPSQDDHGNVETCEGPSSTVLLHPDQTIIYGGMTL